MLPDRPPQLWITCVLLRREGVLVNHNGALATEQSGRGRPNLSSSYRAPQAAATCSRFADPRAAHQRQQFAQLRALLLAGERQPQRVEQRAAFAPGRLAAAPRSRPSRRRCPTARAAATPSAMRRNSCLAFDHRRHDGAGHHVPPAARLAQQVEIAAHRQPECFRGAARQAVGHRRERQPCSTRRFSASSCAMSNRAAEWEMCDRSKLSASAAIGSGAGSSDEPSRAR